MAARSILIIDDDPGILTTIASILKFEGYQVQTASNGAEGLSLLEGDPPSLVILDMRMPILDGWGFARTLDERGMRLPILVVTAAPDASRWAQEINAQGYLAKPFDLMELLAAVEQLQG